MADTNPDQHPTYLWLLLLIVAIAASVYGTLSHAYIGENNRPHNSHLLANETMVEHHSAYIVFFVGMVAVGARFTRYWGNGLAQIGLIISIIFYATGIYLGKKNEEVILRDHICSPGGCNAKLQTMTKVRIHAPTIVFTAISLAIAIYVALMATVNP